MTATTNTGSLAWRPRIYAVVVVLVLLLSVLLGLGYRTFSRLSLANRWSLHTYQVLVQAEGVGEALSSMESGFRGYALTGDERFRQQWLRGQDSLAAHLETVSRLTLDNPAQQRALTRLAEIQRQWTASHVAAGILLPPTPERLRDLLAAASDRQQAERRRAWMEQMRLLLRNISDREYRLLQDRAERAARLERSTRLTLVAGGLFSVVLAVALALMVHRRGRGWRQANLSLQREVAERRRAEEQIERLRRRYELILNSAAEGIYGVDRGGRTVFLNPAAARMLGYAPEELVGRPCHDVLRQRMRDGQPVSAEANPVEASLAVGTVQRLDHLLFERRDGTSFPVEYVSAPILEDGSIAGAVILFRDITERRAVDRMKDEFVSVVSHELRTPLTSIRGSLGLLGSGQLGELNERGRRMLDIAVQNTDRLVRLINDILDIERMESGKVTLEPRRVHAAELVRLAVEPLQEEAGRAEITLLTEIRADPAVEADPDRIVQTLTNLVSNALKFSGPGSTVRVRVERRESEVLFQVIDQGRGIPAQDLDRIFQRFHQVDSSDARNRGGSGLGLAISRSIVEQHGGRIWAESEPGRGSTFSFTLALADWVAAPDGNELRGPLVLLCDDDASVRTVIGEMLRGRGYQVLTVGSGTEAVQQAERHRPAIILLDLLMPELDGYQTMAVLREREATRAIPVVIFSVVEEVPGAAAALSAHDWVAKLAEPETLLRSLEKVLQHGQRPRKILLVEDDVDLARVMQETFARHGIQTLHAGSGRTAVELCRQANPDLLILDLVLPDGDGFSVVDFLREDGCLRSVPLIVYSARDLGADERDRIRLGPTDFFTKGRASPEEVERRVVELLDGIVVHPSAGTDK